jgi:Gamma-glutamyltransferase
MGLKEYSLKCVADNLTFFVSYPPGALAAAIPAEVLGYWTVYHRFGGGVPWRDLFEEPIALALNGVNINHHLAKNIRLYEDHIRRSPQLT